MEDFKEIEGLLESARPDDETTTTLQNIRKYAKLALPHIVLVVCVCIYATIGAWIFYTLESPNEDRLKETGRKTIAEMRSNLIYKINNNEKEVWKEDIEKELMLYSEKLYKAFKEQYVRYSDVRTIGFEGRSSYEEADETGGDSERKRRHRHGNKRGDRGSEKMWTTSSALFFAATTMATIGYGNIVPVTPLGRLACVLFALFGAPIAIITIGDLGKFLSECTIWLYKHMRKGSARLDSAWKRFRGLEDSISDDLESASKNQDSSILDMDMDEIDKSEVPVLMVFTIILLYIAFGGILFSILEDWSYMDAFYYSFISLTTIGFGDIVPENHDYIAIMLIYLGVGLSVTTMCIDLAGIQYIQKIHYFGRKFQGTDLLQYLKKKRMLERRLAMGQGEEILRKYVHAVEKFEREQEQLQQKMEEEDPPSIESKGFDNSMMRIDDSLSAFQLRFYDTYDEEDLFSPTIHSVRSFQPSVWSHSSARSQSFCRFQRNRGASWDESGPSLSEHCSLSTEPSVHIRQAYWDNYHSPTPSVISFLHRHLYSPSIASSISFDYDCLAKDAKSARRSNSCPPIEIPSPPPSNSPIGLACMQDWDSYIQMLEEASREFQYTPEDIDEEIEEEEDCDEDDDRECIPHILLSDYECPEMFTSSVISSPRRQLHSAPRVYYQPRPSLFSQCSVSGKKYEPPEIIPEEVHESKLPSPSFDPQTSESDEEPMAVFVEEEKRPPPQTEIDLGAFELVDSGLTPEALLSKDEPVIFHQSMPVHSVHHDTVQTEAALANLMAAPSSMLTNAIPPIMVEDNYCFVVDGERVRMGDILGDDQWWRHTSRPTKYFYSDDLRQFHRVNCITAKGKVITAKLATQMPHQPTTSMSASLSHQQSLSASSHAQIHPQHHSMSNTPRSSISGGTHQTTHTAPTSRTHHDANKVPLNNVYKVIRFYSFWKTCTSFHRIVTMIDKVVDEPSTSSGGTTFKKRLFVQYLWRNAKAVEKARVQKEFDPRRQRLLRFVTDPAARKRFQKIFVEDDLFAVIIDENGNESESEEDLSDSEENQNNTDPQNLLRRLKMEVTTHPGKDGLEVPVYSNDDEHPLDGPHTILHAVQCPKKFIATVAPTEVADTSCFVCDSNLVTMQMIEEDADHIHWKQTMSTTHYYATDNWKDDFYRVTPLTCRGVLRGAYRVGKSRCGKIQRVDIIRVYRVTRHFSCWKTVPVFHRVISLVEAALPYKQMTTKQKQLLKANGNKLINRLFIQYYWRFNQSFLNREQVLSEYAESTKRTRAKKSWIRVVKNVARLRAATSILAAAQKNNTL
ncbi:Potassium channel domain-containing protein [Caenorhabditis elegans]|uniref:Potassium channel domain-containing protein n=1 Tax=Caenorhabditis elegans TaxID=6239 RepID=A0A2X0REL6_CAEEL|nr:Potassium channel domain-containing protein [Caenorhabditis elegans]SPS41578.1 Potassium channel domain-containing protein [Caenorhabditis elegans]|eukprot:NP_001350985.1 TWiK family of potassium channels [Caenorhabditis elegans]